MRDTLAGQRPARVSRIYDLGVGSPECLTFAPKNQKNMCTWGFMCEKREWHEY
ncbi:hypothetical protein KSC_055170 [Ktedonobacter sp. SOSP1-52]|nr:hypothetical protein KSC_055170 [Ktedonobacter sp. SOSP1-52]